MENFSFLWEGLKYLAENPKMLVMWIIGDLLIFWAIKKDIIGAADGPTAISVAIKFDSQYLGAITVAGMVAPASVALVGFLMFGNLIRECGVLNNAFKLRKKKKDGEETE